MTLSVPSVGVDRLATTRGAAGLAERVEGPSAGEPDPVRSERLWKSWANACARGDEAALERRLAWDGIDPDSARRALGAEPAIPAAAWTRLLDGVVRQSAEVARELAAGRPLPEEALFARERPLPFLHLWAGAAREAERLVREAAGRHLGLLAPAALDDLRRRLLNDLVLVSADALFPLFRRTVASVAATTENGPPHSGYLRFAADLLATGLGAFLTARPALARQAALLIDGWVGSTGELVARLAADLPELEAAHGGPVAPVTRIETALSERHRGGRRVMALHTSDARRVVYKPRPVELEAAWERVAGWASERGAELPRPLWVLTREGYGWMEAVGPGGPLAPADVDPWFRRAGGLLALARLLGGSDLHAENLVAGDGGPFLVDAETLLQPDRGEAEDPADPFARTQLLGSRHTDAGGRPFDFGGLTGGGGAVGEARRPVWRFANTDAMRREPMAAVVPEPGNRPTADGRMLGPADAPDAFVTGYLATYDVLARHGDALLAAGGPLSGLADAAVRVLLRPSQVYGTTLAGLRAPERQVDGVAGDLVLEALLRVFLPFDRRPPEWALAADEARQLRDLDVPVFRTTVDGRSLRGVDAPPVELFVRSGREALAARVAALGPQERRRHEVELRERLAARRSPPPDALEAAFLAAAREIGEAFVARSRAAPGTWMFPDGCPDGVPLSPHLYDGAAGIALTLASLARAFDGRQFADLARRAAEPLLALAGSAATGELPLGACTGIGGLVYALVAGGRALEAPEWIAAAEALVAGVAPARVAAAAELDLASGVAGLLLGLLATERHLEGTAPLVGAARERLLAAPPAQAGFAHGASGPALALARASARDRDARGLAAARAGLAAEPTARHLARLGPDLALSWCQGAAGMAIARVEVARVATAPELAAAVDAAIAANLRSGLGSIDQICCGTGGRIELLLLAGGARSDARLHAAAREGGRLLLEARRARGGATAPAGGPGFDPGLFRGLGGIATTFLRLARPRETPSVLGLEAIP